MDLGLIGGRVDHRVISRTIFTDSQIGIAGMIEEEAVAAGHRCWCSSVPSKLVPCKVIHDMRGVIKVVAEDNSGEVLGISRNPARLSCCAE